MGIVMIFCLKTYDKISLVEPYWRKLFRDEPVLVSLLLSGISFQVLFLPSFGNNSVFVVVFIVYGRLKSFHKMLPLFWSICYPELIRGIWIHHSIKHSVRRNATDCQFPVSFPLVSMARLLESQESQSRLIREYERARDRTASQAMNE